MTAAVPSWLHKSQPRSTWPTWIDEAVIGRPDPNGSFIIKTDLGQMRVHPGYMVFQWKGGLRACHASEARQMIDELRAADAPVPKVQPGNVGPQQPCLQAETADRNDDTDEITRRIRSNAGELLKTVALSARPQRAAAAQASLKLSPLKGAAAPAKGSMPSIEWVQLDRLKVDDAYQRSIDTGPSRTLITRIGREWDWRLCVPLMVSRRLDGLYVIDGQHRLYGARLRKDVPQLPCCISVYDGPAAEAAMFVAANRERRAMNRLDDFHAAQAGGDEEALAVTAIVESVGFTVSRKTGSAAWVPGEVAFTSAIAKIYRKHGDTVPRQVLGMMAAAFPNQRLVAGSSVFTAACRLVLTPPDGFDPARLGEAMKVFDMKGWASFLQGSKGGDDRAQRLREMLIAAADDMQKEAAA